MKYHLVIKKSEIIKFEGKRMELGKIVLSVLTGAQKTNITCSL